MLVSVDKDDLLHGAEHTGKRGAVRNNSGLPVDHSGPELRVGPTTPATADRKSEACPPNFDGDGVGVGAGVAVDLAVEGAHSQLKSGRESESGALSGASEASDVLRSAATQLGSSLDVIQINRYTNAPNELQKRGRKRYCGSRTFRGRLENGTEKAVRGDCKTWDCAYCGPRKAWRYKQAISSVAERHQLNRLLTLTLDPRKIEGEPVCYLRGVFNKFRVYLLRKHDSSIKFIAILEFHKSGIPHLHILLDRFIAQRWISAAWSSLGGGSIVDIRYVDVHRVSHYLAKYLTKDLLMSAPARSRRVTTARSIHLLEKKASPTVWVMDRRSIFQLFAVLGRAAQDIQLDCEGFLVSFVLPAGIETPPWLKGRSFTTLTLVRINNASFALLFMW